MRVPLNDLRRATERHADRYRAQFEHVLAAGRFVLGEQVRSFEREFAAYCGVPHCVGVASGSDALEIALRAVGVGNGDEVVTVANAGNYSSLAIAATGATPCYADVDDATLNLSVADLPAALSPRTRAIVVTHLYGRLADVGEVRRIADARGIAMIEDCAQAHGAALGTRRAGSFGDVACFSFYPTKNLGALGDGGALTTRDEALARRIRALREYGWDLKYRVSLPGGRNSRLDEVQAAMLRVRLPALDAENESRRTVLRAYAEGIRHPAIRRPDPPGHDCVAHLAVVRSERRDSLRAHLEAQEIGVEVHYPIPDHRQPVRAVAVAPRALPATERACAEVLSLPCFAAMTAAEIERVIEACNAWLP